MGRGISADQAIERRRAERAPGGSLTVDMRIDFQLGDDPEVFLSVGGRWDRELEMYDGDATQRVVVRMHPGQVDAVKWFAKWMAVHAVRRRNPPSIEEVDALDDAVCDPSEVFSALFAGGRRGGKTWIATAMCAAYAVAFPDAIVFAISPSRGKDDDKPNEIRRYMSHLLAPEWISRETEAGGWELINGSKIALKSAYTGADPDAIKEGEIDFAWMNEGQKMSKRVYTVARGAIADKGGLVLITANPPVEAKDQQWVSDFAADAEAGRRASVYLEFDPRLNPRINRRALLSMRHELDERSYAIEVLGQFRAPIDAVAYNWQRMHNERSVPSVGSKLRDVTEEFMDAIEEGEGIKHVIGLDVQRFPYIGGPVYRFYEDAAKRPTRDSVLAWIVDEVTLEGGDELDWCALLYSRKYDPASTLIICDASGQYQHSRRRTADEPPPAWTGKGSFDLIRGEGFRRIVPPSRIIKKNPEIVDRVRSMTSMICNGSGKRRLFADRELAPKSCAAIREWKTVHGKPSRSQDVAHLGDGVSYPLIRLFPRILRSDKPGTVDPVTSRVDQPEPRQEHEEPRARRRRGGRDGW